MGFPGLPTDHVWHSLGRWGWANVDWCEATNMGYVTEPANTWSNLMYIFVGIYLMMKGPKNSHPLVRAMPWAMIALGFLSGFYHATNAWVTQLGDFVGMYLVAGIPFLINLQRLGIAKAGTMPAYVMLNLGGLLLTVWGRMMNFPIQFLFAVFFGGIVVTEIMLMKKSPAKGYRNFAATLVSFAVAGTFSLLDVTRTMCDPHNHVIQGHALWHCFGGIGLYFAYYYVLDALHPGPVSSRGALAV
jgi:hypothetical protein